MFVYGWYYYHTCRQMLLPYFNKHTLFVADVTALADVIAMVCVLFPLKIIKKNIFPHTFSALKNCWENIFFRPEEAMFDNWHKTCLLQQKLILFMRKSLTTSYFSYIQTQTACLKIISMPWYQFSSIS